MQADPVSQGIVIRHCCPSALAMDTGRYCSSPRFRYAVQVFACMGLSTAISVAMTLYLKWFLRVWSDGGYPFATTMTCVSTFFQWLFSIVISAFSKTKPPSLSRSAYWKLAVPIGLCTSLDFLCSNLALLYITVTFFTIVKASSHVWTLLFSVWLGHQRATWPLIAVIVLISSGIALSSYGATSFNITGFLLVLAAAVLGTLRWVLTQSLLEEIPNSPNQILAIVHYTLPASSLGLLPVAIVYEGKDLIKSKFVTQSTLLLESSGLILGLAVFGFALVVVKILLVKKTSALTLGITGSIRDITQILFAVMLFGDSLPLVNSVGLAVAMSGMLLYAILKNRDANEEEVLSRCCRDTDGTEEDLEQGRTTPRDLDASNYELVHSPKHESSDLRSPTQQM